MESADDVQSTARAIDGDTLALPSGKKIRLIGVNTPELHTSRGAEPLARQAQQHTAAFIQNGPLSIQYGHVRTDHYGRLLGHVFNKEGESLEESLLRAGLAAQVVVGRNESLADCLGEAEQSARRARSGVWQEPAFKVIEGKDLAQVDSGFHLLRTRIAKVILPKSGSWWLETDDDLVLLVSRDDQTLFRRRDLKELQGRQVEVRGWLIDRQKDLDSTSGTKKKSFKRWLLPLKNPRMLIVESAY